MLNAFCRVAPSVRFSVLAIRAACVFFRASAFNVRTCSGVHSRRFVAFLAIQKAPNFERGDLVAPHLNKFNAKKVQRVDNGICLEFKFAAARGTDREDPQLDSVTTSQSRNDFIQDGVYHLLHIALKQVRVLTRQKSQFALGAPS